MSIEHLTALATLLNENNTSPEKIKAIRKYLELAIDSGVSLEKFKNDMEQLRQNLQAVTAKRADLSWIDGADVWIEVGHHHDRGGELRIAFKESPLPGYADFWIPFSAPTGAALGWLRFSYITSMRETLVYGSTEWRPACEPAPAEQERLDLPISRALMGFAATSGDETSSQKNLASEPQSAIEHLDRISFTKAQKVILHHLAEAWLRCAAGAKRDADASLNPNEKRALELKYMAHYNCATELQKLFQTGDLPDRFGFQIRT